MRYGKCGNKYKATEEARGGQRGRPGGGTGGWQGAARAFYKCQFVGPKIMEVGAQEGGMESVASEKQIVEKEWITMEGKSEEAAVEGEGLGVKVKRRGARRRGLESVEVWTANTSGRPQLERTIMEATRAWEGKKKVVAFF